MVNSNQYSPDTKTMEKSESNGKLIKSEIAVARNDGDEGFGPPLQVIGEGTLLSKSCNQFAKNNANPDNGNQAALYNFSAENGMFRAQILAQRLSRKRKFSQVERGIDAEEPVPKRRRLNA
jgi:hypothetical protein